MYTTCLNHYMAEGVCITLGQASRAREEGHGKDKKKGKPAAPGRSSATNRTQAATRASSGLQVATMTRGRAELTPVSSFMILCLLSKM